MDMTPFDNYLLEQAEPILVHIAVFFITGLVTGIICTTLYCVLICRETRAERIKRVYNHKFNQIIKRELL
jgi:uncharacterized membrane protein YciS (DUF1049 family)